MPSRIRPETDAVIMARAVLAFMHPEAVTADQKQAFWRDAGRIIRDHNNTPTLILVPRTEPGDAA